MPNTPSITSPSAGTLTNTTPRFTSSTFSGSSAGHYRTQWQIDTNSLFYTPLIINHKSSVDKTSFTVPSGYLNHNTTYWVRVRYQSYTGQWSSYSNTSHIFVGGIDSTPSIPWITSISPSAGTLTSTTPRFTSSAFSASSGWHYRTQWQIDTNSLFYTPLIVNHTSSSDKTSFTVPSGYLNHNTTYWVRVRYQSNTGQWSSYSNTSQIFVGGTVSAPSVPWITSPSNNGTTSLTPKITSSPYSSASSSSHYRSQWQIDTNSLFYTPLIVNHTSTSDKTSFTVPAGYLQAGTQYNVRVRYQNSANQWSNWSSSHRVFNIEQPTSKPSTPSITSPSDGATTDRTPTFFSSTFSDAYYNHAESRWQIDTDSTFASPYIVDHKSSVDKTRFSVPSGYLSSGTKYYIRVRYKNSDGTWSNWSSSFRDFTTEQSATKPTQPGITYPSYNEKISIVPRITSSTFSQSGSLTHTQSQWQIDTDSGFSYPRTIDHLSSSDLTDFRVPSGYLSYSRSYYVRVRYKNSGNLWSNWTPAMRFVTEQDPSGLVPSTPYITDPSWGKTLDTPFTIFASPFSSPDPNTYHKSSLWQFSSTSDFSNIFHAKATSGFNYYSPPASSFVGGEFYYVRVRYFDSLDRSSNVSAIQGFIVKKQQLVKPNTPIIYDPENYEELSDLTPPIWVGPLVSGNPNATLQYMTVQISTNSFFSSLIFHHNTTSRFISALPSGILNNGATYYLRVRFTDNYNMTSNWSSVIQFTTINYPAPNRPTVVSPAEYSKLSHGDTTYFSASEFSQGGDTTLGEFVEWQISSTSSFSNLLVSVRFSNPAAGILFNAISHTQHDVAYVRVRHGGAQDKVSSWSYSKTYFINYPPPNRPIISSPYNNGSIVTRTPTITTSNFSNSYGFGHASTQWQIESSSASIIDHTSTSDLTSFNVPSGYLNYETTYYIRARHKNVHNGWSDWSSTRQVTTEAAPIQKPDTPSITSPSSNQQEVGLRPRLEASAYSPVLSGPGVVTHSSTEWHVSTNSSFSNIIYTAVDNPVSEYQTVWHQISDNSLDLHTDYYVGVRYRNSAGHFSDWSPTIKFNTGSNLQAAPQTPTITTTSNSFPVTGTLRSSAFVILDSVAVHGSSQWQIYKISFTDDNLVVNHISDTDLTSFPVPSGFLQFDTQYLVRIRYKTDYGTWSPWSLNYHIRTDIDRNSKPQKPEVTYPTHAAENIPLSPTFISSAFYNDYALTHTETQWQVAPTLSFLNPIINQTDLSATTSFTVTTPLAYFTEYNLRVRYKNSLGNWSDWSNPVTFRTELVASDPPYTPAFMYPLEGDEDISLTPTFVASFYHSDDPNFTHAATHWKVSISNTFDSLVIDHTSGPESIFTVPEGYFSFQTAYYAIVRYQNIAGQWSAWSGTRLFITLASPEDQYSVVPPTIESPINDAQDVSLTPFLKASPFETENGSTTHRVSQWQISQNVAFSSLVYDSGEVAASTEHTIGANILSLRTKYYMRVRYQGELSRIWSDWSPIITFRTAGQSGESYTVFIAEPGYCEFSRGKVRSDRQYLKAGGNHRDVIIPYGQTLVLFSKISSDEDSTWGWRYQIENTAFYPTKRQVHNEEWVNRDPEGGYNPPFYLQKDPNQHWFLSTGLWVGT